MSTATEGVDLDEVAQLFEGYKQEHKTSTLTLPQFRQVGGEQTPRAVPCCLQREGRGQLRRGSACGEVRHCCAVLSG